MIVEADLEVVEGILSGKLAKIRAKMGEVGKQMDNPGTNKTLLRESYMNLADYLVGIELNLNQFDDSTNYGVLPMYSNTVLMKTLHCTMLWVLKMQIKLVCHLMICH